MKTLVYFASGCNKPEYQKLDFDKIYLIDNCFKDTKRYPERIFSVGKVTCIGMDCLESVEYLKKENVKIDCFVSLNEGLYEGGGSYAINSDFFLGYAMPLLKDNYIHIMNQNYYLNHYKVSMDLPYEKIRISEGEEGFIDPLIFSKEKYHKGHAEVYKMKRIHNRQKLSINPKLDISVIHDSIWNYYDRLDLVAVSLTDQGQGAFFDNLPKTMSFNKNMIEEVFSYCKLNKIEKLGLTPWGKGEYGSFIQRLKEFQDEYPKQISLFHLSKKDFKELRDYTY